MAKLITMNLFQKQNEVEGGKKYDTYFMAFPNHKVTISTKLSNDVKAKLQLSGVKFPMSITLKDEDYFITKEEYQDSEGLTKIKTVCVLTDYESVEKLEFEKVTLDDYLATELNARDLISE